jgi:hypothetical protein
MVFLKSVNKRTQHDNDQIPQYLDPGSMGGWVQMAQEQMRKEMRAIKEKDGQILLINDAYVSPNTLSDWKCGTGGGSARQPLVVDFTNLFPREPSIWLRLIGATNVPLLVVMSDKFRISSGY